MTACSSFERWAPRSLFWRLVTVWVLSFFVLRLFSFVDLSIRSDDVFMRIFAGTEARYMALHMRLLASEPKDIREEFVRQLGRDRELWVNQCTDRPQLPNEQSNISEEMARQLSILLHKADFNPLSVRASVQAWPQKDAPYMFRDERPPRSRDETSLKSRDERPLKSRDEASLKSRDETSLRSRDETSLKSRDETSLKSRDERPSQLQGNRDNTTPATSANDSSTNSVKSGFLSFLPSTEDRAAQAQAAIEYAPGEWLHLIHNVDLLPRGILYLNVMRIAVECAVMLLLAVTTLFWIVRPLQALSRATEAFGRDMDTAPLSECTGSIEIREAAKAFNSMRLRILSFVRQRSTMLAAVSHDLRTPLTRIRLRLEGMEDESLRASLLADVEEVQQSLDHMIKTVRTLHAGDPEELDRVDLMALLESLAEDMQDMGHNVTLNGYVPGSFWLPPTLYRRCVENIVGNALRYAENADMQVTMESGIIRLDVRDNGPGVPEDRQEHVFEPFYRLETSRNRRTGGYGMGLAIARSLARRYGGDVRLENRPEGGLCVTVTWAARAVTN